MRTYDTEPAGVTDIGNVREHNEDCLLAEGDLFAVADGMGGHGHGGVASRVAIDALHATFAAEPTADGLIQAVRAANQAVREHAEANPVGGDHTMGTTLAAVAMVSEGGQDQLVVANVGDSRVYLLRDGELTRLSTDHSVVGELVAAGALTEAEATAHPRRHVLTQALGPNPDIAPHVTALAPASGDRLLLCSDGLTNEVAAAELLAILTAEPDPEAASAVLVAAAKTNGGSDNITAVVVDIR